MSFLTRLSLANRGLVALIAVVITGFGITWWVLGVILRRMEERGDQP